LTVSHEGPLQTEAVCIAAGHCVRVKLVLVNTGKGDVATKVKLTGIPDRCSAVAGQVVKLGPNVAGPERGTKSSCTTENIIPVRGNGMTVLECDCSSTTDDDENFAGWTGLFVLITGVLLLAVMACKQQSP